MASIKTYEEAEDILKEVEEAFFDIPFGNSAFQIEKFILAGAITPERAYRAIGLEMSSKIRALKEAQFSKKNFEIDRDEAIHNIESGKLSEFDERRELLKLEKAKAELPFAQKLINDALAELNILYKHFKALPKFTRKQFEDGEFLHYMERLNRQQHLSGDQQSLLHMDIDIKALEKFEAHTQGLDSITDEALDNLRGLLSNIHDKQKLLKGVK